MPQSCNFHTVRDDTKQSDWPLPRKIAPHLHRIQLFPTFIGRVAQNGGLRHNGLAPLECMGFEYRVARNSVMGLHRKAQFVDWVVAAAARNCGAVLSPFLS